MYGDKMKKQKIMSLLLVGLTLLSFFIRPMTELNYMSGIIAIIVFMLPLTKQYQRLHTSKLLTYSILLFTFGSITLGTIGGFYDLFEWWDILLHISSGFIIGMVGLFLVELDHRKNPNIVNANTKALVIFSFPLAIGVLWEIFEFSFDFFLHTNLQRSGLYDTMTDLIVATVGAFVAVIFFYIMNSRKK